MGIGFKLFTTVIDVDNNEHHVPVHGVSLHECDLANGKSSEKVKRYALDIGNRSFFITKSQFDELKVKLEKLRGEVI